MINNQPTPTTPPETLYERLRFAPKSYTDEDIKMIIRRYAERDLRGRMAQVPQMALDEWNRRHSPTEAKQ